MWNLLEWLYPSMALEDCSLSDMGTGPFIDYWNTGKLGPQPTEEYLQGRQGEFELKSLRTQRITEVYAHGASIINNAFGDLDQIGKNKSMVRQMKLLLKKTKGTSSIKEDEELDNMEELSDYADAVDSTCDYEEKEYLESNERTLQQLQEYSAETSPNWPSP